MCIAAKITEEHTIAHEESKTDSFTIGEYAFVTQNTFLTAVRIERTPTRKRSRSCDTAAQAKLHAVRKGHTTIMLHSVSCRRPPELLFDLFARLGFTHEEMDYVYFPMREKGRRLTGTGYMFINFCTPELASDFLQALNADGLRPRTKTECSKAIFCSYADIQGCEACVQQFLQSKGKGLRNPAWLRDGDSWTPLFRN